jgi:hypothetical protein
MIDDCEREHRSKSSEDWTMNVAPQKVLVSSRGSKPSEVAFGFIFPECRHRRDEQREGLLSSKDSLCLRVYPS